MRVLIFGATGMIGQAALRESLQDPGVTAILSIGRTATGIQHPRLREITTPDLFNLAAYATALSDHDAAFFCLGVTSAGLSEEAYTRLTFTLTTTIAKELASRNPGMIFTYVSGSGTDSTEKGRSMWARVKGRTENTILRLPFRAAYIFRPGFMVPLDGIQSKTRSYRIFYNILSPILPLLHRLFPQSILTTREIGQAMLIVARSGAPKHILEARDIRALIPAR